MSDQTQEVGFIIYQQLGGNRFRAMTGAKLFVKDDNSLRFSLPRTTNNINRINIALNGKDLYDIRFSKLNRKLEESHIKKFDDVYAEDMVNLFETETGLFTRL